MLKDWKQTEVQRGKYGNDYIVWEKNRDRISLWGLTAGRKNQNKKLSKNNIKIIWQVKGKKFKTKAQALRFAKNYMRRN